MHPKLDFNLDIMNEISVPDTSDLDVLSFENPVTLKN